MRLLVEHGAETTKVDVIGKTAEEYAEEQGKAEMVRILGAKRR